MTSIEIRNQFLEKIAELEQVIANNEFEKIAGLDADLKEIESEFRAQKQAEIFGECAKAENPLLELAKVHSFDSISHKLVKEDDVVVGVDSIFDKRVALDAVKFCKRQKLSLVWAKKCEKLAYYLCEDLGAKLNVSADEMEEIRKKYKFTLKDAKGQDLGKNPISKTQFCKTLQGIVDDLLYIAATTADGKKENSIRIINADVEFVKRFFTKGGNEADLSIKTISSNGVSKAVFAAVHRIVAKKSYSVKFKTGSADDAAKPADEVKSAKSSVSESNQPIVVPAPTAAEVSAAESIPDTLPSLDQMEGAVEQ